MASRIFNRIQALMREQKIVNGSFRPAGTGTPVVVAGKGYTVARTSAGLYTVTFADKYPHLVDCQVSVRVADTTPTIVQAGDFSAANKTLQIRTLRAATGGVTEAKGFVPIDISSGREIATNDIQNLAAAGGILASDSQPDLLRVNAGTDKALRITWAATEVDEVQLPPVPLPPDLDASQDVTVHLLIAKGTNTDAAAVIDVQAFEGVGDTEMGGNTAALDTDALTEYSVTLANADITGHPGFLNLSLIPGAHANDAIYLYAMWLEYTRADWATSGQVFSLADLASDVDNVVNFTAFFKNVAGATG